MILADASVWIAHRDHGEPVLADLLRERRTLVHPYAIGKIALGRLPDRSVLTELSLLPAIVVARHDEVMHMIEAHSVWRIGYVDAHLLASALLVPGVRLWTRARCLRRLAERLGASAPYA